MFWRKKLRSLFRPRRHQVTVLRAPAGDGQKPDDVIRTIAVREGWMLLDALLKRGVDYPHLCKLGDCRRCKSVLVTGTIARAGHYAGALNPDEEARGVFLACRATPTSDCSIRSHKEPKAKQQTSI
ncbi:MAG: 2Fe-2S iron-sulfur cluster-binding protein [bacterium]|nr:2Fe-2S iron-sulfur cluster-binding protein [bacterium]